MTPHSQKLTRSQAKNHNQRLVLRLIYQNGQISRADIARLTGLTRTTASTVVSELMEKDLVEEVGLGPSSGGKPPTMLHVPDNARQMIGVDLAGSALEGALFDLRGNALQRASIPIARDRQDTLQQVMDLLDRLTVSASQPLLGIGIGLPGLIDSQLGVVYQAHNLGWTQMALGDIMRQRYQLPVTLVNDSQAAALAEYTFTSTSERRVRNLAVVVAAQSISAGIILDGQLYRGQVHSGASEIGHVRAVEEGDRCVCGHYGCLETIAGERALLQAARNIFARRPDSALGRLVRRADDITPAIVAAAYRQGDPPVRALCLDLAQHLGAAIAHVCSLLNVPEVVLSGYAAEFGPDFARTVEYEVWERTLPLLADRFTVRASTLGADSVELGAAATLLASELGVV